MDFNLLTLLPPATAIALCVMGILIRQILVKVENSITEAEVRQLISDKLAVTTYAQQQLDIRLTHIERQLDKILENLAHGKHREP